MTNNNDIINKIYSLPRNETKLFLCQRLKELRILNNISMREMAKYLNIDFQKIQKIEKGKIRLNKEYLYKICERLNINIEKFINNNFSSSI